MSDDPNLQEIIDAAKTQALEFFKREGEERSIHKANLYINGGAQKEQRVKEQKDANEQIKVILNELKSVIAEQNKKYAHRQHVASKTKPAPSTNKADSDKLKKYVVQAATILLHLGVHPEEVKNSIIPYSTENKTKSQGPIVDTAILKLKYAKIDDLTKVVYNASEKDGTKDEDLKSEDRDTQINALKLFIGKEMDKHGIPPK